MAPSEFVKTVVDKYDSNRGIFKLHKNAEDLTPVNATRPQKALFLFYIIQLDYATKSQRLYENAQELFKEDPDFFDARNIFNLEPKILEETLRTRLRPRYLNEAVCRYIINSKKLLDEYEGDPLTIFIESTSAKQALKKVLEFRGFGPKIGNFLVRTFVNTFVFEYPDIENMLPPVDVHDVRIAHIMNFVDSSEMSQRNILKVKNLWHEACITAGVSWLKFDKALWLLGSEGLPKTEEDIIYLLS